MQNTIMYIIVLCIVCISLIISNKYRISNNKNFKNIYFQLEKDQITKTISRIENESIKNSQHNRLLTKYQQKLNIIFNETDKKNINYKSNSLENLKEHVDKKFLMLEEKLDQVSTKISNTEQQIKSQTNEKSKKLDKENIITETEKSENKKNYEKKYGNEKNDSYDNIEQSIDEDIEIKKIKTQITKTLSKLDDVEVE